LHQIQTYNLVAGRRVFPVRCKRISKTVGVEVIVYLFSVFVKLLYFEWFYLYYGVSNFNLL